MTENYDKTIYNEPYCVKDGCLYEAVERKGKVTMVRLCDYVPVLKSEITFDDGTECRKAFEVGAVHSNGAVMPTVTVDADEMSSMKWLIEKWGSLGSYSPANNTPGKIRHAIMSTKSDVEFKTVYSQTGWRRIGERYEFLMPSADSPFTVELQGKLNAYQWRETASADKLFYLAALLENGLLPQRVMLPLLAVTFLSPLEHFLKKAGCEPKFITALVGKTGTRKSTTAALMCSFFGNFTASTLPMSFHDTAKSKRVSKMPPLIMELLKRFKTEQSVEAKILGTQWIDNDRLFTKWNGEPMNPQTPFEWLKGYCERIGIPFKNIHSLRHLHASLLIFEGVDVVAVSADMGHSVVGTTLNLYSHMFQEARARNCEAISNALKFAHKPTECVKIDVQNRSDDEQKEKLGQAFGA